MRLGVMSMALALALAGCGNKSDKGAEAPPPLTDEIKAKVRNRARGVLKPMKQGLKSSLMAAMAEGGAPKAVDACRAKAPAITARANERLIKAGRTASKLRNPANAPSEWLKPVLAKYGEAAATSGSFEVVALDEGRYGYAEPIYTGNQCLVCHGDTLPIEVKAALKEFYPKDEATGFKPGQLRGLFWVEMHHSVL